MKGTKLLSKEGEACCKAVLSQECQAVCLQNQIMAEDAGSCCLCATIHGNFLANLVLLED